MIKYTILPLEKYKTANDDLLFWIKHFMIYKLTSLKMDESKADIFDIMWMSEGVYKAKDINIVSDLARDASKAIGGIKPFIVPLKAFYDYIEALNLNSIRDIDQSVVKDFILVANSGWSDSKKNTYYTKIKTFFNFLQEHNTIKGEDTSFVFNIGLDAQGMPEKIIDGKPIENLPKFLDSTEMQKLDKHVLGYTEYRDETERAKHILIIRLLMFGMITLGELRSLRESDFLYSKDKDTLELRVGNRSVPLFPVWFTPYIDLYKKSVECKKSEFFFCGTQNSNEISTNTILSIIGKHFKGAGIKAKPTADTLRNSGAIYLYRNRGMSEARIQELLGHKNKQTTQRLLKVGNSGQFKDIPMWDGFSNYQ